MKGYEIYKFGDTVGLYEVNRKPRRAGMSMISNMAEWEWFERKGGALRFGKFPFWESV
jgi:hypothetical protein